MGYSVYVYILSIEIDCSLEICLELTNRVSDLGKKMYRCGAGYQWPIVWPITHYLSEILNDTFHIRAVRISNLSIRPHISPCRKTREFSNDIKTQQKVDGPPFVGVVLLLGDT